MSRLAALLLALPLAAAAQGAPAAPDASQSAPRPRIGVELGGFLAIGAYATFGGLDSNELARAAAAPANERAAGMTARASRVSVGLTLPADGLLAQAQLDGLVEADFLGGTADGDPAAPLPRLREAWLRARLPGLGGLEVLLGQSSGLLGGTAEAVSLGHLGVSRFEGAGYLTRRAPQLRLSMEWGGDLALRLEAAALAPTDKARTPAATSAAPDRPRPAGVGERSGLLDGEGRVALLVRPQGRRLLEVGLSGHAGRERWLLSPAAGDWNAAVDSYAVAVDARLDVWRLTALASAYAGRNLDVLGTLAPGVTLSLDAAGNPIGATGVGVAGGWLQAQLATWPGLTLLAGGGVEVAARNDLPPNPALYTVALRNLQASGGALVDLTSRWQVAVEYTAYLTRFVGPVDWDSRSGQLEVASRYTF